MINDFENDFENEEGIPVTDKRRFTDDGVRIDLEENDEADADMPPIDIETAAGTEKAKTPEVKRLEEDLIALNARCEAAETKLIEVQKRFEEERENLEKETAERRERMMKSLEQKADSGRFNFLNSLLPVLDNLNLAVDAGEKDTSFENLLVGVKGTARSFEQALMSVGVEPVQSVGELFNPEIHEAVDIAESDEEDEGKVTKEYSRGYTYKGRLLRPARVQVGKGKEG